VQTDATSTPATGDDCWAAADGVSYRFPFADGELGDAEALIQEFQQPTRVALFTWDDGAYLDVGESHRVSRFRYDAAGVVGDQETVPAT